jgi:hypothetical protein
MAEVAGQKLEQLEKLLVLMQQMLEVVQQEFEVLKTEVVVAAAAQKFQELLNTGMKVEELRHYS